MITPVRDWLQPRRPHAFPDSPPRVWEAPFAGAGPAVGSESVVAAVWSPSAEPARTAEEPSTLVDRLFAGGEQASLAGMTIRRVSSQADPSIAGSVPEDRSPAGTAGAADIAPSKRTVLTRSDVDQVVSTVIATLKRQERLEREARGLI